MSTTLHFDRRGINQPCARLCHGKKPAWIYKQHGGASMLKIMVRHKLSLAAVWALSMTGTSAHGDVIHACVLRTTAALRIIDANKSCSRNERAIQWDQIGPAGPAGPAGFAGPAGPTGLAGPAGPAGLRDPLGQPARPDRRARRVTPARHRQFGSSPVRIAFAAETTKSWLVLFARAARPTERSARLPAPQQPGYVCVGDLCSNMRTRRRKPPDSSHALITVF